MPPTDALEPAPDSLPSDSPDESAIPISEEPPLELVEVHEPPPRPTTPPVRMVFLKVLGILSVLAAIVYGIPILVGRAGYAWEAGRSKAAIEALAKLDEGDVQNRASALFRLATKAVSPAVVNVRTTVNSRQNGGGDGLGSGVIMDKENGYVVTNHHVIKDADKIVVRVGRSHDVEATVVGSDERTDLAVLKIPGPIAVAAEWGDSDKIDVGDWVLAIGSPFALDRTVTAGIISASGRNNLLPGDVYEDFLQTDAAINPGNSGGPLIDLRGKVIGINTAIFTPKDGSYSGQGIGLAISSALARRVVDQLIKNKRVIRGYLGVLPDLNVGRPNEGVRVASIRPGSPADQAGIKQGDLIVGFDGKPIENFSSLRSKTFTIPVGQAVAVEIVRGEEKKTVQATIAEMPSFNPITYKNFGFDLREIPGLDGGGLLVSAVRPGSPAALSGFQPGLLITAVERFDVRTIAEFDRAVEKFNLVQGMKLTVQAPNGQRGVLNLNALGVGR